MTSVVREQLSDGTIKLSCADATFSFQRPRPQALLVTISGLDRGQFGSTTLDEITSAMNREGQLELFIDARNAVGATVNVSDDWTRFFSAHRSKFERVHVLVQSKAVELTVAIAQHLSRTGDLIRIYSDPVLFQSHLGVNPPISSS